MKIISIILSILLLISCTGRNHSDFKKELMLTNLKTNKVIELFKDLSFKRMESLQYEKTLYNIEEVPDLDDLISIFDRISCKITEIDTSIDLKIFKNYQKEISYIKFNKLPKKSVKITIKEIENLVKQSCLIGYQYVKKENITEFNNTYSLFNYHINALKSAKQSEFPYYWSKIKQDIDKLILSELFSTVEMSDNVEQYYDEWLPVIYTRTNEYYLNQEINARINILGYYSKYKFDIVIGADTLKPTNGICRYKLDTKKKGTYELEGGLIFTSNYGEEVHYPFKTRYAVY